jgi:hypothetical protein
MTERSTAGRLSRHYGCLRSAFRVPSSANKGKIATWPGWSASVAYLRICMAPVSFVSMKPRIKPEQKADVKPG